MNHSALQGAKAFIFGENVSLLDQFSPAKNELQCYEKADTTNNRQFLLYDEVLNLNLGDGFLFFGRVGATQHALSSLSADIRQNSFR